MLKKKNGNFKWVPAAELYVKTSWSEGECHTPDARTENKDDQFKNTICIFFFKLQHVKVSDIYSSILCSCSSESWLANEYDIAVCLHPLKDDDVGYMDCHAKKCGQQD